jgi:hypothetical protein
MSGSSAALSTEPQTSGSSATLSSTASYSAKTTLNLSEFEAEALHREFLEQANLNNPSVLYALYGAEFNLKLFVFKCKTLIVLKHTEVN